MDNTSAARFSAVVSPLPPDKSVNLTDVSNNSVDLTIVLAPKRIKWMAVDAFVKKGSNELEKVNHGTEEKRWSQGRCSS